MKRYYIRRKDTNKISMIQQNRENFKFFLTQCKSECQKVTRRSRGQVLICSPKMRIEKRKSIVTSVSSFSTPCMRSFPSPSESPSQ